MDARLPDAFLKSVVNLLPVGSKTPPTSKRRETRGFDYSELSHIAPLILSVANGHWPIFGAEHVLPAPAMAHHAGCPLRPGEPAAATGH